MGNANASGKAPHFSTNKKLAKSRARPKADLGLFFLCGAAAFRKRTLNQDCLRPVFSVSYADEPANQMAAGRGANALKLPGLSCGLAANHDAG